MTSGILGSSREPRESSGMPRDSPREFSGILGSPMNRPGNHIGSASRASEVPTVALAAATDPSSSSSSQVMRVAMPSSSSSPCMTKEGMVKPPVLRESFWRTLIQFFMCIRSNVK